MPLELLDYIEEQEERARARAGDPETSHEAAASVSSLTKVQKWVLYCLEHYGPLTDEMLYKKLIWYFPDTTEQSVRSRRAELVRKGLVAHKGLYGETRNGRRCRVWEIM